VTELRNHNEPGPTPEREHPRLHPQRGVTDEEFAAENTPIMNNGI
jgi:hypothetical protein